MFWMDKSRVEKLAIGTVQFGMPYGIANSTGQVSRDEAYQILKIAYVKGIHTIDTARGYGESEAVIGGYISQNPQQEWEVITKISKNGKSVNDHIEVSTKILGQAPYAVLAHNADDYTSDPDFMSGLFRAKDSIGIKKIGVSIYNSEEIEAVMARFKPDIIQLPLNILDTRLVRSGTLEMLKEQDVEIHVRSIFLQGLFYLSQKEIEQYIPMASEPVRRLRNVAEDAKLRLSELSLLWAASVSEFDKIVIGVDCASQLQEHLTTLEKPMDGAVFQEVMNIAFEDERVLNPSLWPAKS